MAEAQKEWLSFARGILPLGLVASLVLAGFLSAQEAPCLWRTVVANVVDQKGNPVPGLSAAGFQAKFRGEPVKIASATFDQRPRRIVILLDTSEGMRSFYLFTSTLFSATIKELRSLAPAGSAVAVATFSDKFQLRMSFSSNWEEIEEQLAVIHTELLPPGPWKGRKVLRDSLLDAVALFGSPRPGDAILLFSDGRDIDSRTDYQHVEHALWLSGIRFLVFVPPPDSVHARIWASRNYELKGVAHSTGEGISVTYVFCCFSSERTSPRIQTLPL